jgi:hypothetical protein
MKVTNSTPPGGVEARSGVMLGLGVELEDARPHAHVPVIPTAIRANLASDVVQEVKVSITMKYSSVRVTLRNILLPMNAATRDVINAR